MNKRVLFGRSHYCLLLASLLFSHCLFSQSAPTTPAADNGATKVKSKTVTHYGKVITKSSPQLTIHLSDVGFEASLPFDEQFLIVIPMDPNILSVDAWYQKNCKNCNMSPPTLHDLHGWLPLQKSITGSQSTLSNQFRVPALDANEIYGFFFSFRRTVGEEEKPALTAFIQSVIAPELYNHLRDARSGTSPFEFNNREMNDIISRIETNISTYMTAKGMTVNFPPAPDEYRSLFNSLKTISNAFETANVENTNIKNNVHALDVSLQRITTIRSIYNQGHPNADTSAMLDSVIQRLNLLTTLNPNANTITSAIVKNYTDLCSDIVLRLTQLQLGGVPGFDQAKKDLLDLVKAINDHTTNYFQLLQEANTVTQTQTKDFIDLVAAHLFVNMEIDGTTMAADFDTNANWYVSGDLGVAAIIPFGRAVPYVGTNIYFRPVNKNIILAASPHPFGYRFSAMFGISLTSIAKPGYRTDLFGSSFNLVTGAGIRLNDFFRINGGILWYQQLNENPLNSNNFIHGAPFVAFSIDIDVKTALNNLFEPKYIQQVQK